MLVRKLNVDVNGRSNRHGYVPDSNGRLRVEGLSQYRLAASGICCLPILKTSLLLQALKNQFLNILWIWTILSSNFQFSCFNCWS